MRAATIAFLGVCISTVGCSHGGFSVSTTQAIPRQTIPGDFAAHDLAERNGASGNSPALPFDTAFSAASMDSSIATFIALSDVQLVIDQTADAATPACWDFVRTVTLSVESTLPQSSLPRVAVATAQNPGCITTLSLTTDPSVDLKPYVAEGLRVSIQASGIPPAQTVTFDGTYELTLSVF